MIRWCCTHTLQDTLDGKMTTANSDSNDYNAPQHWEDQQRSTTPLEPTPDTVQSDRQQPRRYGSAHLHTSAYVMPQMCGQPQVATPACHAVEPNTTSLRMVLHRLVHPDKERRSTSHDCDREWLTSTSKNPQLIKQAVVAAHPSCSNHPGGEQKDHIITQRATTTNTGTSSKLRWQQVDGREVGGLIVTSLSAGSVNMTSAARVSATGRGYGSQTCPGAGTSYNDACGRGG